MSAKLVVTAGPAEGKVFQLKPESETTIGRGDQAQIMVKVRHLLAATHAALKEEVGSVSLATPPDFDPSNCHFVKGENLESFPYQYLDFPKHFHDSNAFAFRTLFWWGHHVVCALILEGEGLKQHKARIVDRFHQLAGRHQPRSDASLHHRVGLRERDQAHPSGLAADVAEARPERARAAVAGRRRG